MYEEIIESTTCNIAGMAPEIVWSMNILLPKWSENILRTKK